MEKLFISCLWVFYQLMKPLIKATYRRIYEEIQVKIPYSWNSEFTSLQSNSKEKNLYLLERENGESNGNIGNRNLRN